jgi:RHS repeat-associated protein
MMVRCAHLDEDELGEPLERAHLYVYPGEYERSGLIVHQATKTYDADVVLGAETQYLLAGTRIVWKTATGPTTFDREHRVTLALTDLIQSTAAVFDVTSGELLELSTYYPNGARETHRTTHEASYQLEMNGFTGKEADEEVGLTYFGERYLISRLGRWASPDPLAVHQVGGGEALNSYHYVSGNLLQGRDAIGLKDDAPSSSESGASSSDGSTSHSADDGAPPSEASAALSDSESSTRGSEESQEFTPREGGGIRIVGERREDALRMIRSAAAHSPSFRERLLAQDARGSDEAITIYAHDQTEGVTGGASTLALSTGPDSGRSGSQILDIGDLEQLPSITTDPATTLMTQEEAVIHEVTEAMETRRLDRSRQYYGPRQARRLYFRAHQSAIRAGNQARTEFGQTGRRVVPSHDPGRNPLSGWRGSGNNRRYVSHYRYQGVPDTLLIFENPRPGQFVLTDVESGN